MASIRGLAYPLRIENGNLAVSADLVSVEDQIISVLETRPFERVMRANYGFDPGIFDVMEPNAINARIYNAVKSHVKDVTALEVQGDFSKGDGGLYNVTIKYAVSGIPQPPLQISLSV